MSRVSYFQRFSQPENHATNNTLLVLRYFYQSSPAKIQRALTSLLDTELSIGLDFAQQVRSTSSVLDAHIMQEPLRLFIETKRGGDIDAAQIRRHFESIVKGAASTARGDILIALTKEPIADSIRKTLTAEGFEFGITFATITFSQIVEALRENRKDFETDLVAILEDYESYLAEEKLLEERSQLLVIFPCGTSIVQNAQYGLYYEPPSRSCKRNHKFIGIYNRKTVAYVGTVEAIAVATHEDGKFQFMEEAGHLTDDHRNRIEDAIEATPYYDLKTYPHRFYLVDYFASTNAKKTSSGGIMGMRYLDLERLIDGFDARKNHSTEELAMQLNGATWE